MKKISFSSLKLRIKSFKTSNSVLEKILYYSVIFLWRLFTVPYRFLLNSEYRSLMLIKYFNNNEAHQISNYTEFDRYPDLFKKCQELKGKDKELTILSYGCSTGEEVFTLRKYFPNAMILGVDINQNNIKKALKQNTDGKIFFHPIF